MPNPTLSALVAVAQWEPLEVLDINQKSDGNFTCSGVKNGTEIRCGYNLRGETAVKITNMIDDISVLPPRTAIQYLRALADISLCQYHKIQARKKAVEWTTAVERFAALQPIVTSQHTPPPPQRPVMTPQSTPSQSSGISSQLSSESRHRQPSSHATSSSSRTVDVENEKRQLRDDIARLTARLAMLETRSEDEGSSSNAEPSRRVSGQSSSRSGLRSAFGIGRRNH